jgi:hypothetical protein
MKKIAICLLLFFCLSSTKVFAQNEGTIIPTLYCLGSCPTERVTETPTNEPSTSVAPSLPSSEIVTPTSVQNEEVSSTPTSTASSSGATSNPANGPICTNLSQFFANLSSSQVNTNAKVHIKCASQKQQQSHQKNDGFNGGNLSKFIAQLLQLIAQLLQMCLMQSPPGTPTPTLSPSETPLETPSTTLPVSLEPTTESTPAEGMTSVLCKTILSTPGIKPTAVNTGVPAGVSLTTTLPAGVQVNGDSWKVTTDGTVIDGKDIKNKWVDIEAKNVTIKNSRIKAPDGTYWAVGNSNTTAGLKILNSEIYTTNGAHNGMIIGSDSTVCGVNGHGFENIAVVEGNNIIMQANYFHINKGAPGYADPHNDGMEVRAGSNIKILGNNLTQTNQDESWQHNTSALYVAATYGNIDQTLIDGNWFGGGTYSLYTVTVKGQVNPTPVLKTIDITNNKWYRSSYAYGPHSTDDNSSWKAHIWSNNTFEDNGQAISF